MGQFLWGFSQTDIFQHLGLLLCVKYVAREEGVLLGVGVLPVFLTPAKNLRL